MKLSHHKIWMRSHQFLKATLKMDAIAPVAKSFARSSGFLEHPIFNSYHSETAMLRYLRNLADRDLALGPNHDSTWFLHNEA